MSVIKRTALETSIIAMASNLNEYIIDWSENVRDSERGA